MQKKTLDKGEDIALGPLEDLYFGPEFTDTEIEQVLGRSPYSYRKYGDIEQEVAELLATGQIVARFKGRMEFGARALGNRSILANPSHAQVIRIINEMVKNRDFWMPFAPSILDTRAKDYFKCDKNIQAPYMMIAIDSSSNINEIAAASHPYDNSIRPQIVYEKWNRDYWCLIKKFEKITGIGAILNTSFNLHGHPIVCSPEDAIEVFMNSGLNYMAIGNFLVEK